MYPPNSSRGPTPTIQNLKQGAKDFCPCCTYTQNIVRQMVGNHYFFYWTTSGGWFTERGKLRIEARLFVFKCNKSDIKRFQKVRPHFSIVMVIYDKKISNDWWNAPYWYLITKSIILMLKILKVCAIKKMTSAYEAPRKLK